MRNQVSEKYFKAKAKVSISHMDESDLYGNQPDRGCILYFY